MSIIFAECEVSFKTVTADKIADVYRIKSFVKAVCSLRKKYTVFVKSVDAFYGIKRGQVCAWRISHFVGDTCAPVKEIERLVYFTRISNVPIFAEQRNITRNHGYTAIVDLIKGTFVFQIERVAQKEEFCISGHSVYISARGHPSIRYY